MDADSARELLFADVTLVLRAASAQQVAAALEHIRKQPPELRRPIAEALEAVGALSREQRERVAAEVDRIVHAAEDDPALALSHRGGIDHSIHSSLLPDTSAELLDEGVGARAPLRVVDSGRYRDFAVVGKGGMGVVYLALDTELNRKIAFKMVRPDPDAPGDAPAPETPLSVTPPGLAGDLEESRSFQELKVRFLQEAWVTGAMEHPGVVPVYELGTTATGIPYYTMRYFRGERTLATAIHEAKGLDERLALLEPFLKVCDAIRYAHARGVLHRDLKPENVALGEFGEAVVLDWGLSKMEERPDHAGSRWRARIEEFRDATDLQTVAGALGTPGYMAPEALLGQGEEVDEQSDVYSLGALLFEILTGRLPHRFKSFAECIQKTVGEDPPAAHEVAPGVPPELSDLCSRALARNKEERFDSVDALAGAVRRWQTEGRLAQQINDLLELTRKELQAAQETSGDTKLWHLDRAMTSCTRVLHLEKDQPDARTLMADIRKLRFVGIKERVRIGRRKAVFAVGFLIVAVAALVTLGVANTIASGLRDAEEQLAKRKFEVQSALQERDDAVHRRADLYANLSSHLLEGDWVAGARLAAAQAVAVAPSPQAWRALAAAEARWTPTLVVVLSDLVPGPVAFGPGGDRLLVCASDGVREFDLGTREYRRTYAVAGPQYLAVSPDRSLLATLGRTGLVQIWDIDLGTLVRSTSLDELAGDSEARRSGGRCTAMALSRDGRRLHVGYTNERLVRWDIETGSTYIFGGRGVGVEPVTTLREGSDGKYLYVGHASGTVSRRDVGHLDRSIVIETGVSRVVAVTDSPKEDVMYLCSTDRRVGVVELDPVRVFTRYRGPPGPDLVFAGFLRERSQLCAIDVDGVVSVGDFGSGKRILRLRGPGGKVTGFAVSPDESRLAVGYGEVVCVWALGPGPRSIEREPVTALTQSPDGKRTWIGRPDHSIELWDNEQLRTLARWRAHTATITALATDGERVVSASLDGTLAVWPARGEVATVSFPGPTAPTALALGDGGAVLTGSIDGAVEIWSTRRKRRLTRLHDSGELPMLALVARDGQLHAWDCSGKRRTWDLRTNDRIEGASCDLPPATASRDDLPPIDGEVVDWIRRSANRRLIASENRLGFKVEGAVVVPVPPDQYEPRKARVFPWSR